MLKVLITSSKGGCGKTTVATNLAAAYARENKNTVIVDADRQGSSQRWCEKRPDNVPGILPISGLRRDWAGKVPADTQRVIVDSPAGIRSGEINEWLDAVNAVLVPILPSAIDFDATEQFLMELSDLPKVKRGKVPVALIANKLKPWTTASQQALENIRKLPFPIVAQLRDTQAYVLVAAMGKGIFDYNSEIVRGHQEDWNQVLRWLKKINQ